MGKRRERNPKSQTLPSSPCHSFSSSSSSDFEFRVSRSPHKSPAALCPADDLFYKGQLLPLQLSPRLSMVRTLILASSSSSSDSATTSSRDSSGSSSDSHSSFAATSAADGCDSSRPSSVAEEDREFTKRPENQAAALYDAAHHPQAHHIKKNRYFSLSRFSSVFRKELAPKARPEPDHGSGSSVKRASASAKDVIRKYLKKVRPLYEKLSQQKQQKVLEASPVTNLPTARSAPFSANMAFSVKDREASTVQIGKKETIRNYGTGFSHSFSGNLRYPRRRSYVSSCPSSIRSSPSHSGALSRNGGGGGGGGFAGRMGIGGNGYYGASSSSSMEELQSAIQGAIAYCKSSMIRNDALVSNEL